MDYQISEDEFNSIASCADQIDLLTSLCTYIPAGHHAITIEGLESFLIAQNKVLRSTLKALEEREDAQRITNTSMTVAAASKPKTLSMPVELLVRIMQACSGAVQGEKAMLEVNNDLYDATVMHGEVDPLWAYHDALRTQGFSVNFFDESGALKTTITRATAKKVPQSPKAPRVATRKRDRLVGA